MMNRSVKIVSLLSGLGILAIAILFVLRWQPVSGTAAQETPAPTAPSQDEILARGLRAALEQDNLSPASRESLQEKLELIEGAPEAISPRGEKNGLGRPPIPDVQALGAPQQAPADEILEGSEGLVHTWEADVENLWQGERDGVYYQVLAGASADRPSQGLIIVIATQRPELRTSQRFISAPGETGALRVEEVRGNTLILSAQNNSTLKFDVLSGEFLP